MKKIFAALLAVTMSLCAVVSAGTTALAADEVKVMINGTELQADVPAQIIGDRTMVPMRAIFETLGANVTWIPENQAIFATKSSTLIVMRIGDHTMAVSDIGPGSRDVTLDVPPQIVDDRTLVPVRAISEALGCTVDWDGETRTVTIVG